uniref:CD63 antigen-like n=2 Tax=Hirondellea gigas TaxID=1518452 RepID=A0A2P2HZ36_9CRUS
MRVKTTAEYVAFGALLFITVTGLALLVLGACMLAWAAYLSPWMPSWVFVTLSVVTGTGVAVAATSAATAIATIAPKPQAAHKLLVVLLIILGLEIFAAAFVTVRQPLWSVKLYKQVEENMQDSLAVYSTNRSSAAMWDEIQFEVSCCGVLQYTDWFVSGYSDDSSVPDACCLLPQPGCGQGIRHSPDPEDQIDTQGCLPILSSAWSKSFHTLSNEALLPIAIIQVIMVTVLLLSYRQAGLLNGHVPLMVAIRPSSSSINKQHAVNAAPYTPMA